MDTIEALKQIGAIERQDTAMFRMAVSHLMDTGARHFTDENVKATMESIDARHKEKDASGKVPIVTSSFEKSLVSRAAELAKFDTWDLLLYIKRAVDIYDPLAPELEEADEE